eukprot:m.237260 g.237260  ORF g.237260 m.237260 type:complete len:1144 (+) comp33704_c0_seq1:247-3678(+)
MGIAAVPVWIVRRVGRQGCVLLVLAALIGTLVFQRRYTGSTLPRPMHDTSSKDVPQLNVEGEKEIDVNREIPSEEKPIRVVPTDPVPIPTESSTVTIKKQGGPRTDYQWIWAKSNGEKEVMLMDSFILWRNTSGVSVGVLAEGMFDSITFPSKTKYETDMQCVWEDGTKSDVAEINFLFRMKIPVEKRWIAYQGPDNTLTKPFHDYYRTHRIHCDNSRSEAVLKGLARKKTAWQVGIPLPPVEKIPPSSDRLSICLSPLFASANSRWLIEWLEYHRHAGVSKVHVPMYHDVSESGAKDFWKIINHYSDMGFVVITPWSPRVSRRATELNNIYEHGKILAWNACWLQFKGSVDWLAFVDVDEVLAGNTPDTTFDAQLDYADSVYKSVGKMAYSIRSATVASMFNDVDSYSISQRLLMDEFSETELKQFCQGHCGKYHHSRDKLLLRAREPDIPLVMMWTHAIGGNDYDYADKMMMQLDKSIFYLKHFNGWWLLRDKPSNKQLLEWQPERMERRDAPVPAGRLFLMQQTIEKDPELRKLYMDSYAKKEPDWLSPLVRRLEKRTYRPPWTVNTTCGLVLDPVLASSCSTLYSPSVKVAVVELPGFDAVEEKFHAQFTDGVKMQCKDVPAGTYIAAFLRDPVHQFVAAYDAAMTDSLLGKGKQTPELVANDIGHGTMTVEQYWARGKVAQTVFEKYTHQVHRANEVSLWSEHFTLQASVLVHFKSIHYLGKADDKLGVSWSHFLSNLGVASLFPTGGYEQQDHDTEQPSHIHIKMNDLSQRTLDKICAHVAADLPCLRSPMCDLEWMRPSASSSRSLLSTTVSVEKATVCKAHVDSFFKIGSGQSHCPQSTWLDRMREVDDVPEKNIIIVGCNKGFDAIKYYERWDASNVVYSLDSWKKAMAANGMDKCGRCGGCLMDDITLHGEREKYKRNSIRSPLVFCVEALPSNYEVLVKAQEQLKYDAWHGGQTKALIMVNAAASNSLNPPTIKFPKVMEPGRENVGVDFRPEKDINDFNKQGETVDVETITVDSLAKSYKLDKVDILTIDAEGHDPLILEGAYTTIRRLNVRYVEFENHSVGQWANSSIKASIDFMDEHGFDCYWAGHKRLWPITTCWSERYEGYKHWSNIVCARRVDPWHAVLEEFVLTE